jgi:hypothetical protein
MLGGRKPSFDLTELSGCSVNKAKARCESDGFTVQLHDLEQTPAAELDYRPNRIRFLVQGGKVVEAHQG